MRVAVAVAGVVVADAVAVAAGPVFGRLGVVARQWACVDSC